MHTIDLPSLAMTEANVACMPYLRELRALIQVYDERYKVSSMANRNAPFVQFMEITKRLKGKEGHFLADSDTSVGLRGSQMPGSPKW